MKIVLRADVETVGKKGDIIDVADGFARNFLIPKGKAILATDGVVNQAAAMRRARDLRDAKDRESAEAVARRLVPAGLPPPAQTAAGRDAVAAQTGVELDRRRLHLDEPIKTLGTHQVAAKLHSDVEFPVTVEVVKA